MRSRLHDPLRGEPYRRGFIVRNANRCTRVARTSILANTDRDRLTERPPYRAIACPNDRRDAISVTRSARRVP